MSRSALVADDYFDYLDEDENPDEKLPKKVGRPRGSKNRPKEALVTKDRLEALYNRVQPYLTKEQRKYIEGVIDGSTQVDPQYELQLLIRQMSIMFSEAATAYWAEKRVDQNIAKFADSLRMAIKDLHDIDRIERERAQKQEAKDGLVPIADGGSPLERLKTISGHDFS